MARGNILVTQLGADWFATCFTGQESLSAPFNFNLTLAADSSQIKPDSLLGKNLTIQINDDHESRIFNGIVSTCKLGGIISDQLRECTCVLVPWFWFLQYDSDCRIFQDKTVIQIFNSLCKEKGFSDYNLNNLKGSYKPIPYCVQYNESTFDFLNRILARAGIYYYFTYQKDKHTMVLADNSTIAQQFAGSVVYTNSHSDEAHIHEWSSQDKLHANQFAQKDYDYNTPSNKLLALGKSNLPKTQVLNATKFEKFSYPGNDIKNITNFHDNQAQLFLGQGNYPSFRPGLNFNLSQHADKSQNSKYFLMSVEHSAADKTHFLENTGKHKDEPAQVYTNNFICMPAAIKYQSTDLSKPSINSTQTAMVVGPKQNEIYTDRLGRIKVRFHWDRNAPENSDDTTCWIRVSQQLADSNWGFQFIPRVGSEVIVDFLHGDPDCPIITGSLHNAAQLPPYQYPNEQTKTGIKTRSIGQKSAEQSNELQFNDAKDAEQLYIHASKDYENAIKQSMAVNINQNSTDKINQDRTISSQKDHTIVINKQINIAAGKGEITINPDSITLQAPRISLGNSSGGGGGAGAMASGAAIASGGKNKDKATDQSDQQEENMYPSAEVNINAWTSTLGPYKTPNFSYVIRASNLLDASLKVSNKKSVNPSTFDKDGFKVEAKNETAKVFSKLKIENPASIIAAQPTITLYNTQGEYTFALTPTIITEDEKQYTGTLSKDEAINDGDWTITGGVDMNLTVNLSKDQDQGLAPKTLVYDLEHDIERVRSALASLVKSTELVIQNAPPPEAAIIIIAVSLAAIAAAPVGA